MNERILELAKQADLIQWDTHPSGARTPDHASVVKARKFAELIANECAAICDRFQSRDVGMQPAECAGAIRKMFGVEE